jgi:thiol:disulfide interchange protein DsbA
MAALFAAHGVDANTFNKTYASFGVNSQIDQATARARSFELQGTPEMVVAGKYRITGDGLSSQAEVLKVVDYLVARERQARAAQPQ